MMETITKPTPEMLAAGQVELPEPDDEVPEMIIPQVQEERVIQEAAAKPKRAARTSEVKADEVRAEIKREAEAVKAEIEKTTPDPDATQDEKREIVQALRAQGKTDDQIRETFYTVTGKKGGWKRSDIEKLRAFIGKEAESPEKEADDFLKEMEG